MADTSTPTPRAGLSRGAVVTGLLGGLVIVLAIGLLLSAGDIERADGRADGLRKELEVRDAQIRDLRTRAETAEVELAQRREANVVLLEALGALETRVGQLETLLAEKEKAEAERRAAEQAEAERLKAEAAKPPPLPEPLELGAASIPIHRALAREGETLAEFAAREKTPPELIRALNPWLQGDGPLKSGQALWVMKSDG